MSVSGRTPPRGCSGCKEQGCGINRLACPANPIYRFLKARRKGIAFEAIISNVEHFEKHGTLIDTTYDIRDLYDVLKANPNSVAKYGVVMKGTPGRNASDLGSVSSQTATNMSVDETSSVSDFGSSAASINSKLDDMILKDIMTRMQNLEMDNRALQQKVIQLEDEVRKGTSAKAESKKN